MMTLHDRVWKDISLDDTINEFERSKLAVWDYPVTDKYTKIWRGMQEANLPQSFEEALERVRHSPSQSSGFAFIGNDDNYVDGGLRRSLQGTPRTSDTRSSSPATSRWWGTSSAGSPTLWQSSKEVHSKINLMTRTMIKSVREAHREKMQHEKVFFLEGFSLFQSMTYLSPGS